MAPRYFCGFSEHGRQKPLTAGKDRQFMPVYFNLGRFQRLILPAGDAGSNPAAGAMPMRQKKQKELMLMEAYQGYHIVRCYEAGVFFAQIKAYDKENKILTLHNTKLTENSTTIHRGNNQISCYFKQCKQIGRRKGLFQNTNIHRQETNRSSNA